MNNIVEEVRAYVSKYSTGFLIASLIQAGIIMITKSLGVSTLGAKLTATQLLIHIIAGQIVGYILLFIMIKLKVIDVANIWAIGSITGVVAWIVLLSINSEQGTVRAPQTQGFSTTLPSIIAFIAYGVLAIYTIKKYYYKQAEV